MRRSKFSRAVSALLTAAVLLGAVLSAAPAALAAEGAETIRIRTAEDLAALAESCVLDTWSRGKTVILQNDISLEDADFEGIPTFGGTFDGNGHTISGLQITQNASPAGMFAILQETGVVKNLRVSGVVVPSGDGGNVGGVVGENYGTVTGCGFTGSVAGSSCVGGVVGVNADSGRIDGCAASGSVVGDQMTGGIAGCSLGSVSRCENSAYVNTVSEDTAIRAEDIDLDFSLDLSTLSTADTSMASSDSGGIVGYSSGIVTGCVNGGPVGYPHTGYNVGGVAGRSCGYLYDCENNGVVCGRKDVGGIVGQMEPYIARQVSENTLAKLEGQLEELDALLNAAMNDMDSGVGALSARLSRIADHADSAAAAAHGIRTYGSVTTTVAGGGAAIGGGSVAANPPDAAVAGSAGLGGTAGAAAAPTGGGAAGGIGAGVEIQGGLTEGQASAEGSISAGGSVDASTQIALTTSLNGLSSAISGMAGQMRLLSGEITAATGALSDDLRAVQRQIGAISDTMIELLSGEGEGDILVDSSEADAELATLGKAAACGNTGSVHGDINVGGVAGAMAMEYELDPEDDLSSGLSGGLRRQYELKAIIRECVNTGSVTAKRSYAGGICGRMELGSVSQAENYGGVKSESGNYVGGIAGLTASTVRHCFAKCTLSGGKYVGGIVGSGVAGDLSGDASTVAGCYSMVSVSGYREFTGAVSGADAGTFAENVFVSDTLAGINGRSYAGQAEPVSYAALLERSGAAESGALSPVSPPEAFLQFTLTFEADGVVLKEIPFDYGASFGGDAYPDIPEKEGYYAAWDRTELEELHFDTTVSAVYTSYVAALTGADTRSDGRPIFFVEGRFDDGDAVEITPLPNTPDEFDALTDGWLDFLKKCFSGPAVSRGIVEQWSVSIPDDGAEAHTIRYLAPDGDPERREVYVKRDGQWEKAEAETVGSYLTFPAEGAEAEVAVLSTMEVWWVWLIAAALLLLTLAFLIRLFRKLLRRRRAAKAAKAARAAAAVPRGAEPPAWAGESPPPRKKRRWVIPLLMVLALLIGAGVTAAYFVLPDLLHAARAYDLLRPYAEKRELFMELSVEAVVDSQAMRFTAAIDRTDVEGRTVTAISRDGQSFYYYDGAVFLENGTAYQVSDAFPDYSRLLEQALDVYRYADISADDGNYSVTVEGTDAAALFGSLVPAEAGGLGAADALQVEMLVNGAQVSALRFYGSGTLNDGENTSVEVSAALALASGGQDRIQIPEAVRDAVAGGEYEAAQPLSEDLLRVAGAWQALNEEDALRAKLTVSADCGPVILEDSFALYRWESGGTRIGSIQKNGFQLYFTDTAVCDQNGGVIQEGDAEAVEAAKLLDVAYQFCLNAEMDCVPSGAGYIYTASLDGAGMEAVAYAVAPETEDLDVTFTSGSIQAFILDDELQYISFDCAGTVRVALVSAGVSIGARIDFSEEVPETALPEAARKALAA